MGTNTNSVVLFEHLYFVVIRYLHMVQLVTYKVLQTGLLNKFKSLTENLRCSPYNHDTKCSCSNMCSNAPTYIEKL